MSSEVGDMWRQFKEEDQQRRANNRENGARILSEYGIDFLSKNDGAHLIVITNVGTFDYWPGTGRFKQRNKNKKGIGIFNLVKFIQKEQSNLKEKQS